MSESVKQGDVVALASGGLPMTVIDVGARTGMVWCRWMDATGTYQEKAFAVSELVTANRWWPGRHERDRVQTFVDELEQEGQPICLPPETRPPG